METGTRIGPYEITGRLGAGGMGEVYRAHDPELGRCVAIKAIAPELADSDEAMRRFRREARILASLDHPGIATVFGVERAEGRRYLVLELIEGSTLAERLGDGPLPAAEARDLTAQIAEALAAAHERGIVHRDLKPGNVMVTPQGTVKLVDFGIARAAPDTVAEDAATAVLADTGYRTEAGVVVGTTPYMSPEQLRAEVLSPASDVWALGCVYFELLTGVPAFARETAAETVAAIQVGALPESATAQGLAAADRSLLDHCLALQGAERPSAGDVAAELRGAAPRGAEPPKSRAPRPALARRIAGIVAAALATTALLWLWAQSGPGDGAPEAAVGASEATVTVALQPLRDIQQAGDTFAAGMAIELAAGLQSIRALRVIPATTLERLHAAGRSDEEIADMLDIDYWLEGSIRAGGDGRRINVTVVDVVGGQQLMTRSFEADDTDLLATQEEVARAVADALDLTLSAAEQSDLQRRYTAKAGAYEAYLQGMALMRLPSSMAWHDEARAHFRSAIDLDPDYALAYAGLVHVEADLYLDVESTPDHLQEAQAHAEAALRLAPRLAQVRTAIGFLLAASMQWADAARELELATELDPRDAGAWRTLAMVRNNLTPRDSVGTERAARTAIALGDEAANYYLASALVLQGRVEEGRAALARYRRTTGGGGPMTDLLIMFEAGDGEGAVAWFEDHDLPGLVWRGIEATAHSLAGDNEVALRILEQALARGYSDFAYLEGSPYLEQLRADPRFVALLSRYRE